MIRSEIFQTAKPILFSTDMVRAILDGKKTVTRRAIKHNVDAVLNSPYRHEHPEVPDKTLIEKLCSPAFRTGDYLYVRETWQRYYELDGNSQIIESTGKYVYAASPENVPKFTKWVRDDGTHTDIMSWRPSIHMPKEAARIFLHVTDMRAERLQDITDKQAKAEGANFKNNKNVGWEEKMRRTAVERFAKIWNSTIPKKDLDKYGWDANPWVWVIEFERVEVERWE